MKITVFLFLVTFSHCFSYVHEITLEEQAVLEKMFRSLFADSECGYVLYNKKPVSETAYWAEDPMYALGIPRHEESVVLKEGARVWKKLNLPTSHDYIFQIYERRNPCDTNFVDMAFIHRKSFLEVVEKNLSLFQYVLGPELTPESLFEKAMESTQSVQTLLKYDKVLTGIVLGFGTQNSLFVSRLENLQKEFFQPETPPLKPVVERFGKVDTEEEKNRFLKCKMPSFDRKWLLFDRNALPANESLTLSSSFGFSSLPEEIAHLSQKITSTSDQLIHQRPCFLFGRLKNDVETAQKVAELEKTQKEIQNFLKSDTFLSQVLNALTGINFNLQPLGSEKPFFLSMSDHELESLPRIIAKTVLKTAEDQGVFDSFMSGMRDAERDVALPPYENWELSQLFVDCAINRQLVEVKKNLLLCEAFFESLEKNPEVRCIIPGKLYFRVSTPGKGESIADISRALMHYAITSGPNHTLLCNTRELGVVQPLDLSTCIAGLQRGISGMRIGEIRDIYMHPSLGYGLYTTLERGQYLKATVELVDVLSSEKLQEDQEEYAIKSEIPSDLEETYTKQQELTSYIRGHQLWSHFKASACYTLDQVMEWVEKLRQSEELSLTVDENELMNKLHWNLYQKNPLSTFIHENSVANTEISSKLMAKS